MLVESAYLGGDVLEALDGGCLFAATEPVPTSVDSGTQRATTYADAFLIAGRALRLVRTEPRTLCCVGSCLFCGRGLGVLLFERREAVGAEPRDECVGSRSEFSGYGVDAVGACGFLLALVLVRFAITPWSPREVAEVRATDIDAFAADSRAIGRGHNRCGEVPMLASAGGRDTERIDVADDVGELLDAFGSVRVDDERNVEEREHAPFSNMLIRLGSLQGVTFLHTRLLRFGRPFWCRVGDLMLHRG